MIEQGLDFRGLSVSPTYVASHSPHLISYAGPTTFSLLTESLGFTKKCHNIFVGFKYVGMPYLPKTCLICSENPLIYGMTTGILLVLSLSGVTIISSDLSPSSSLPLLLSSHRI